MQGSIKNWKKQLGSSGEEIVAQRLLRSGWQIRERNWRAGRYAEIDIIAQEPGGLLVFIEVKTRCEYEQECGFPRLGFESVDRRKQQKIVTSSQLYLSRKRLSAKPHRIDVVVVTFPVVEHHIVWDEAKISHVENAFSF